MGDTFAMHDGELHARERARIAPHLVGGPLDRRLRPDGRGDRRRGRSRLARRRGAILIGPFTFRLPGLVMAALFAVATSEEHERFLASRGRDLVGPRRWGGGARGGRRARAELEEWTSARLAERRSGGGAGRPARSGSSNPTTSGAMLDDDYIRTNVNFLAAAGSSTVDYALRNVLWALLEHPELAALAAARATSTLRSSACVTETLRFAPPVPYEGRIVDGRRGAARHGRSQGVDRARRARIGDERRDRLRRAAAVRPVSRRSLAEGLSRGRSAVTASRATSPSGSGVTSAPATSSRASRPWRVSCDSSATGAPLRSDPFQRSACTSTTSQSLPSE